MEQISQKNFSQQVTQYNVFSDESWNESHSLHNTPNDSS